MVVIERRWCECDALYADSAPVYCNSRCGAKRAWMSGARAGQRRRRLRAALPPSLARSQPRPVATSCIRLNSNRATSELLGDTSPLVCCISQSGAQSPRLVGRARPNDASRSASVRIERGSGRQGAGDVTVHVIAYGEPRPWLVGRHLLPFNICPPFQPSRFQALFAPPLLCSPLLSSPPSLTSLSLTDTSLTTPRTHSTALSRRPLSASTASLLCSRLSPSSSTPCRSRSSPSSASPPSTHSSTPVLFLLPLSKSTSSRGPAPQR